MEGGVVEGGKVIVCFCVVQDNSDARQLLARSNVDLDRLYQFSYEAASWSTALPRLNFAVRRAGGEQRRGEGSSGATYTTVCESGVPMYVCVYVCTHSPVVCCAWTPCLHTLVHTYVPLQSGKTPGVPDVALFDFTSMYAAEHAARVVHRRHKELLLVLVGDSLLEVGREGVT